LRVVDFLKYLGFVPIPKTIKKKMTHPEWVYYDREIEEYGDLAVSLPNYGAHKRKYVDSGWFLSICFSIYRAYENVPVDKQIIKFITSDDVKKEFCKRYGC